MDNNVFENNIPDGVIPTPDINDAHPAAPQEPQGSYTVEPAPVLHEEQPYDDQTPVADYVLEAPLSQDIPIQYKACCDDSGPAPLDIEELKKATQPEGQYGGILDANPVISYDPYSNYNPQQPGYNYYTGVNTETASDDKKTKKSKRGLKVFAFVLALVVLASGCFSVGYFIRGVDGIKDFSSITSDPDKNTASAPSKESYGSPSEFDISVNQNANQNKYSYADVASIASKSVVSITIYSADGSAGSYASGVIMTADGYVLTNDHIYTDISSPQLLVTLSDNTEYKADFVAGDTRSDLSIIKLRDASGLTPATFGSSAALRVGDEVMAIGQSNGLSGTVSTGIVSSKDRRVAYTAENYNIKLIQTTAAINPGSSGGALVNMSGEVIGIASSKIVNSEVEGICFAIPSDYAIEMVENMKANGTVKGRAKLGITYTSLGTVEAEVNDLPRGVLIQSISKDSCLYGKGVEVGDVIIGANGKDITCGDDLLDIIEAASAGDTISFKVYKPETDTTVSVSGQLAEYIGTTEYTTIADYNSNVYEDPDKEDFLIPNP